MLEPSLKRLLLQLFSSISELSRPHRFTLACDSDPTMTGAWHRLDLYRYQIQGPHSHTNRRTGRTWYVFAIFSVGPGSALYILPLLMH